MLRLPFAAIAAGLLATPPHTHGSSLFRELSHSERADERHDAIRAVLAGTARRLSCFTALPIRVTYGRTPLAAELAKTYTVVSPDLRGMGLSAAVDDWVHEDESGRRYRRCVGCAPVTERRPRHGHDIGNIGRIRALVARFPPRVTRWVVIDRAPLPGIGDWDNIIRSPPCSGTSTSGAGAWSASVQGRERIYLDRFLGTSFPPTRRTSTSRRASTTPRLYARPRVMHDSFEQFAAFNQDAIDNKALLARTGQDRHSRAGPRRGKSSARGRPRCCVSPRAMSRPASFRRRGALGGGVCVVGHGREPTGNDPAGHRIPAAESVSQLATSAFRARRRSSWSQTRNRYRINVHKGRTIRSRCLIPPHVYTTFGTLPARCEASGLTSGSRERASTRDGSALSRQHGTDGVTTHRTYAVRPQQPALIELDRRAAVADLDELPGKPRLQNRNAFIPAIQVVGVDEVEVLVVLPRHHRVGAIQRDEGTSAMPLLRAALPVRGHAKLHEVCGSRAARIGGSGPYRRYRWRNRCARHPRRNGRSAHPRCRSIAPPVTGKMTRSLTS